MEPFGSILSALGSIASIASLAAIWKAERGWLLRSAFISIFILTATSSYLSYQYYELTQPEGIRESKQIELRAAIKEFLSKTPINSSYWEPGQNEGIIKSGLIILELYRDLFPETYLRIKKDIDADITYAQQYRDKEEQRRALDTAAKSILTTLKALSGND